MIANFAKRAASLAAFALGTGLAGCFYSASWGEVDGVAFADFDQGGEAPEGISLSGTDTVIISDGDAFSMTLEGDEEAQNALRFERNGNTLKIARDQNVYSGNERATVRITMPAPSALSVSGASTLESEVMASDADIDTSGASTLSVAELDADYLDLDLSGASKVSIAGSVERMKIDISGAGSARMGGLVADDVDVDLSGSSDLTFASNGIVRADMSGASRMVVIGSATCTVESSGASSYSCRAADSETAAAQ